MLVDTRGRKRVYCGYGLLIMTTIFLVRHGQTVSNARGFYMGRSDEDLSEVGYEQARRLAARMAGLPVTAIYASPLRRTYNTASILAGPHGLEPMVLDELIELDVGDWRGRHVDEISRRWPELWRQWMTDPSGVTLPNGESLDAAASRAAAVFHRIAEADRGKQVVIVTHEVIVKLIAASVLAAPNSIYRRFEIGNASLTVIRQLDDRLRVSALNDTSHLL
jgi:broad specificity phosphatase PhoE